MHNLCYIVLVRIKSQVISVLKERVIYKSIVIRRQGSLMIVSVYMYHRPHEEEPMTSYQER